jgi:hypothetical protein
LDSTGRKDIADRKRSERLPASQSFPALARFVGVPVETLALSQSHEFSAEHRFGILQLLNRDFLETKANHHCGELMETLSYPPIRRVG